jgi:serine/threonine-protein kinase
MLGAFGEVHLLDWGVAKVRGEVDPVATAVGGGTVAGAMLGTPGYMPPEQLRGGQDRVDGRADVDALGATLYGILARERLHGGASVAELVASTLEVRDRRPSARRADVAPELDAIAPRHAAGSRRSRPAGARARARDRATPRRRARRREVAAPRPTSWRRRRAPSSSAMGRRPPASAPATARAARSRSTPATRRRARLWSRR